jgi:hypothetical protein
VETGTAHSETLTEVCTCPKLAAVAALQTLFQRFGNQS